MKIPRNLNGHDLVKKLRILEYEITRQKGSHIRITTQKGGEHHEVIPAHKPMKPGTLASILKSIAAHHEISTASLIQLLDL